MDKITERKQRPPVDLAHDDDSAAGAISASLWGVTDHYSRDQYSNRSSHQQIITATDQYHIFIYIYTYIKHNILYMLCIGNRKAENMFLYKAGIIFHLSISRKHAWC